MRENKSGRSIWEIVFGTLKKTHSVRYIYLLLHRNESGWYIWNTYFCVILVRQKTHLALSIFIWLSYSVSYLNSKILNFQIGNYFGPY